MAASKELITKIVLRGQADGSLSKAFKALSNHSDTALNKLKKIGDTAKTAFKVVGTAVGTAAVAAAKSAIDFESAFAGVKKTVDETKTTTYEDLSKGIRNLSKVTPTAATEIAAVAEAAGQLGIKADDILNFSKTMIDLGESTNLTSDEAATSIAKLFNVTGTSMTKVGNFGSTLVALGNNAATTESDILAMATRIAGSGSQIGLTEQQILALSTALSSVGIEAEMGGSAISTTMSQIDKDVAMNSENLAVWAKTAGMTTSQFSKAWKNDAYGALQKVISGMATTKDEGGNLNVLLEELGINGIRQGDTLKRLANASGLMADMTSLANTAWSENSALTKEANTRYATMASKLKIFKNKITDAAITVGNKLLPIIDQLLKKFDEIDMDAVADKICNAIQWVIDNFGLVKAGLVTLAAAFAAFKIGSFITTISGAVKEVKMLAEAMGVMEKLATLKAGGMSGAFAAMGTKISGAMAGIKAAIVGVGPVGWAIIAVIGVLVVAFTTLWKKNEAFRNKITSIWNGIKEKFSAFSSGIVERINLLGFNFKSIGEIISKIFSGIGKVLSWFFSAFFVTCFESASNTIGYFLNYITGFVDIFVGLFTGDWARVWEGAKAVVVNNLKLIIEPFKWLGNFIKNLFGAERLAAIGNWFAQLPSRAASGLQGLWSRISAWGANLWAKAKEIGRNFLNGVVNFFKQLPYKIGYFIGFCIGKVILFGKKLINFATTTIPQFITKTINWFKQLPSKIATWFTKTITKTKAWGAEMKALAKQKAIQFIQSSIQFFKTLPSKISTWFTKTVQKVTSWGSQMVSKGKSAASKLVSGVVNTIKNLPSKMKSIGKNVIQGLWNGIKNAKDWLLKKIKSFGKGITDGIAKALGCDSPSKITAKTGLFTGQGIGVGLDRARKFVAKAANRLRGVTLENLSGISLSASGVGGKVQKFGSGGTVTRPQAAIVGDKPETIVPHGNTPRNRSLLAEAARGVGASSGGATYNFTFAPVINGGNANENRAMLQEEEEAFERRMEAWIARNGRLAF